MITSKCYHCPIFITFSGKDGLSGIPSFPELSGRTKFQPIHLPIKIPVKNSVADDIFDLVRKQISVL